MATPAAEPLRDHDAAAVQRALGIMFAGTEVDVDAALAAALDLLAGPPRIKPSRGLIIDPHDSSALRWDRRVAAAVAVLESPVAARVADELLDELTEDSEFAADVLAAVRDTAALDLLGQAAAVRLR